MRLYWLLALPLVAMAQPPGYETPPSIASGYNTYNNPDVPLYQTPAGPNSLNDMGPGSGAPLPSTPNQCPPEYRTGLSSQNIPTPSSVPAASHARVVRSSTIVANNLGGYEISSPYGSWSIIASGGGGYTITGSQGSSAITPDGMGGYSVSGPDGLITITPNGSGGYNVSGTHISWTIVPNGAGGYIMSGSGAQSTITPNGSGGFNVSGPANPTYLIPVLANQKHTST